jgi:hypothetical protein
LTDEAGRALAAAGRAADDEEFGRSVLDAVPEFAEEMVLLDRA